LKIFKWDDDSGDLGVCFPVKLVERLCLQEGDDVEVTEGSGGQIIISVTPAKTGAQTTIVLTKQKAYQAT